MKPEEINSLLPENLGLQNVAGLSSQSGPDEDFVAVQEMLEKQSYDEIVRESLANHVKLLAEEIRAKYGSSFDYDALLKLLDDNKNVRYLVSISFDSSRVQPGFFGIIESKSSAQDESDEYAKGSDEGYQIILHELFKNKPEQIVPLVLYYIPVVNYGELAVYQESEIFGSNVLGMTQDDYYQLICDLTDSVWGVPE